MLADHEDLPKVPIPDLHKTFQHYLDGLKPVIPQARFEQTKRTVEEFLKANGEGEKLQALLQEYANEKENWIAEFWMDDMYFMNPIALPVNSSPFYLLPKQHFCSSTDQLKFACRVIQFAYEFKHRIDSQSLTQDFGSGHGKGQPLCMQTYNHFFTAYRIPGEEKDQLFLNKNTSCESQHIVVACRNQFYVFKFNHNEIQNEEFILDQLNYIWFQSKEHEFCGQPMGILTSDNRRTWARARKQLLLNETNRQSLSYLETCLYVLCLDESVTTNSPPSKNQRLDSIQNIEMDRQEPSYIAAMLLHGGGSEFNSANRWFDKFLQIVIGNDGICGLICEHSASEGITVLRFLEEFLDDLNKSPIQNRKESVSNSSFIKYNSNNNNKNVIRLTWAIDNSIYLSIQDSINRMNKLVSDLDLYVFEFNEYGKNLIKNHKMSPDSYIQLALQLTYYKVERKLVSTYESASIRQFKHGRVDNIRAATLEALAWSKSMCDQIPQIQEKHQIELFVNAIKKQNEILKYTISGQGPDNHLVGLREISKKKCASTPDLFKEKAFKEFIHFRLSTSQLPTEKEILVGYGPVVPDGYGCSYNPRQDSIVFCISSFFSSDETSSKFFAISLQESLLQMKKLCLNLDSSTN